MEDRIRILKDAIVNAEHHKHRIPSGQATDALARDYAAQGFSAQERAVRRFVYLLRQQDAVTLPQQRIVGMRTMPALPQLFTAEEYALQQRSNGVCAPLPAALPSYAPLLEHGFLGRKAAITQRLQSRHTQAQAAYLNGLVECIDAILAYCGNYAMRAEIRGDRVLADTLRYAMEHGAGTLREALQILRITHMSLWCAGLQNVPLGRLDQLLMPYYWQDKQRGMPKEEAISLVSEFYLCLLLDQDLYPAGANSQAITLGGVDEAGNGALNEMTLIAMLAALELQLPQLEIRLRANARTPASLLELAAKLRPATPLHIANDDVIIPALVEQGYAITDARQYAFGAGCTILVPGALDDTHVASVQMYQLAHNITTRYLDRSHGIAMLMNAFTNEMGQHCDEALQAARNVPEPCPVFSFLHPFCIEEAQDFAQSALYHNYGIVPEDLVAAADLFNIVRAQVFDGGEMSAQTFIEALQAASAEPASLAALSPQTLCVGNNDDAADSILKLLSLAFLDCLRSRRNERGGLFLAGAAPDTQLHMPGANSGPAPIIYSYTKLDMQRLSRSGPLLLPLPEGASPREAAQVIALFLKKGGNQLKLAFE